MELVALYPFEWKGQQLETGDRFTAESPEDDALLEYWAKFGKYASVDQAVPNQLSAPAAPPAESETSVMTTAEMPSHVGRRQRTAGEQ